MTTDAATRVLMIRIERIGLAYCKKSEGNNNANKTLNSILHNNKERQQYKEEQLIDLRLLLPDCKLCNTLLKAPTIVLIQYLVFNTFRTYTIVFFPFNYYIS